MSTTSGPQSSYDPTEKPQARLKQTGSHPTVPASIGEAPASAKFGKFTRTEKLGAGGMGEVWKAWDGEIGRWVALKFLKGGDEDELMRFKREASLAGNLSHPNIAAIYDVGDSQGRYYIALQYIDGKTLKVFPHDDLRVLVELIKDASLAVAHANEQGVIHRDIKPENMMVTSHESGKPRDRASTDSSKSPHKGTRHHLYVMDFGLARAVDPGTSEQSVSGTVVGTPSYMPPEQARGERVDERADVYSLGATLYHVATGKVPFRGANIYETLKKVQDEDPVPPRQLNPKISDDLETIVLKCLEKDPARRYQTARDLAADLQHFLDDEPIDARRASVVYRLKRSFIKRRAVVAMGVLGVIAIAVAMAVLLPKLSRERALKARTEEALQLWSQVSQLMTEAELSAVRGNMRLARERLDEGVRLCREQLRKGEQAQVHFFIGRLQTARHRPREAYVEFDRALTLDPNFREARFDRGLAGIPNYMKEAGTHILQWSASHQGEHPTLEDLERIQPTLKLMREGIIADLSTNVGTSTYLRKLDHRFGEAELLRLKGEDRDAGRMLKEILAQNETDVRAMTTLAIIEFRAGNLKGAHELLQNAVQLHQGYYHAYKIRLELNYEVMEQMPLGREGTALFDACMKDANRIIALGDEDGYGHLCRAHLHRIRGDIDAAIRDGREASSLDPLDDQVHIMLGHLFFKSGDNEAATIEFEQALKLNSKSYEAYNNLGLIQAGRGDLDQAMRFYDLALKVNPNSEEAFLNRASVKHAKKDTDGALKDCDQALRINPKFVSAYANKGTIRMRDGDLRGALADYETGLSANPNNSELHYSKGCVLDLMERTGDALSEFDMAIMLDPGHCDALINRAEIRIRQGTPEAAFQDLDQAIRAKPKSAMAFFNRGTLRMDLGDAAKSIPDFDEALRLDPRYVKAWVNRANARSAMGDAAGAIRDLDEALRIDPSDPETLINRGAAKVKAGDSAGAMKDYTAAIQIRPIPEAYVNRGNIYYRDDHLENALSDYRKCLELSPANWPHRAQVEEYIQTVLKEMKR